MPSPEISESVKPVIFESVTLIVALVALNQPGNFRMAPFFIVNRLFAPPTGPQVPARAAGVRARSVANSPARATDQTIRSVRALAFRSAGLDIRGAPRVEAPGYPIRNATGGHDMRPIQDRFLKRFSDDYPTRYVSVLTSENIRFGQGRDFYFNS